MQGTTGSAHPPGLEGTSAVQAPSEADDRFVGAVFDIG